MAKDREELTDYDESMPWFANIKRTYDEMQQTSLKQISDAQLSAQNVQNVALQALQNAVETANMIGKQAVAHRDIAIDNEWNPVQQGAGDTLTARAVSLDDVALKSIGAAVAAAVANALSKSQG